MQKKQNHRWPQIDRAPPSSGLAQRPRRVHTKSTAPTTPAATNSASSGDTVLKWRQADREIHGAAAVQQHRFDLAHFGDRPLPAAATSRPTSQVPAQPRRRPARAVPVAAVSDARRRSAGAATAPRPVTSL